MHVEGFLILSSVLNGWAPIFLGFCSRCGYTDKITVHVRSNENFSALLFCTELLARYTRNGSLNFFKSLVSLIKGKIGDAQWISA